ncbi:hypothetical protein [Acetobacterium malicum]|nr:hypothetical protein [Acetobacterium dehalogenans]
MEELCVIDSLTQAPATDQAIYDTALIIDGLQEPVLEEVIKHELALLSMI